MKLLKVILKTDSLFLVMVSLYVGFNGGIVDIAISAALFLVALKQIAKEWY